MTQGTANRRRAAYASDAGAMLIVVGDVRIASRVRLPGGGEAREA
jgi:hypothetical protein